MSDYLDRVQRAAAYNRQSVGLRRRDRVVTILGALAGILATSVVVLAAQGGTDDDARLWRAICQVESGGNSSAIGDNRKAVGIAQIWEVTVDDVNRIAGTAYTYSDRLDAEKSRQMFVIYTRYYCGKSYTPARAARVWNGGPRGYNKKATLGYWHKVRKAMK